MNELNATPHAELIAELMNPNNPKNEREHAAVREIERMRESLENPVLEDIEQYRLQMAGICTAAIGYWKDGDKIDPDYNTLALRDVAKLYSKYDALYKAQPVNHAVIAGALFDFMAWLTTRDERLVLSGADEAGPAVEAITAFSKMRGLSLDDAQVQNWQEALAQPEQEPVAFPRQAGDSTWTVDTAFIWRVKHTIDPDTPHDFIPSEEQIETVLLALERIPSGIYTTPPQRGPLTDEEINDIAKNYALNNPTTPLHFARAIEAKLKGKNT